MRRENAMAHSKSELQSNGASYPGLLAALRPTQKDGPKRKKRKLTAENASKATSIAPDHGDAPAVELHLTVDGSPQHLQGDLIEAPHDLGAGDEAGLEELDEDIDGNSLQDPFERHYFAASNLADFVPVKTKRPESETLKIELDNGLRKQVFRSPRYAPRTKTFDASDDLNLKSRLSGHGPVMLSSANKNEKDLVAAIFDYSDVIAAFRTVNNAAFMREICCLHALNHVFKTRDRVLKNNAKLAQAESPEALDMRDQGFTRPKVLIILPTKQACVRFVESIVKFSEPEQQENKSRFLESFSRDDEDEWQDKPEDFRELFGGNHEEDFRIGLKFTRKTIKYFSGFYNSDIIICSPLGLMRSITAGREDKDGKRSQDADFLSSIEVAIVDNASALQMQNWQHVDFIFSQLNQLPKESHGCDFTRVRNSYLDGHAKLLRQTIILSSYMTPGINSLVASHLWNIAGLVKYMPWRTGSMLGVSSLLSMPVTQIFLRFDSPSPITDGEKRFKYFSSTILPQILRDKNGQQGMLLFIPDYADFTRLRNHLSNSSVAFGAISEYTPMKEVSRSRSHLMSGRYSLLLYSERAHHHFRYRIRGVTKVVFYGIPDNPVFWNEVVAFLGLGDTSGLGDERRKNSVRAMFSRWDMMKLERIVGSERVGKLISERVGDVFEFT
jgi:U3 small nucleolar RNA-associated protein 25